MKDERVKLTDVARQVLSAAASVLAGDCMVLCKGTLCLTNYFCLEGVAEILCNSSAYHKGSLPRATCWNSNPKLRSCLQLCQPHCAPFSTRVFNSHNVCILDEPQFVLLMTFGDQHFKRSGMAGNTGYSSADMRIHQARDMAMSCWVFAICNSLSGLNQISFHITCIGMLRNTKCPC